MSTNTSNGAARRRGVAVIVVAVGAALAGWAATRLIDIELTVDKGGSSDVVSAADVAVAALIAGLAAWGTFALLTWRGAVRWWPFVASTALAVSMLGPSYQADGAAAVALIGLHLTVGAVLIAGFGSLRSHRCETAESSAPARIG